MNNTTLDDSPLFTLEAAAEKLTISVRQLRRLIDSGQIPFIRIGERSVRISQEQLKGYLDKQTVCHAAAAN